jgi:hypothetical protein
VHLPLRDGRWGMAFWNLAFLSDRRFEPDLAQSAAVRAA